MTKTTEDLKREMYEALAIVRGRIEINYSIKDMSRGVDEFEHSLEDYLEALRQDLKTSHVATGDIAFQLHEMKTERDAIRNKLQAFEFANKSAGELLIHAQDTIKRQRQSIGDLKTVRNTAQQLAAANYTKYQKARMELSELRKSISSTSARIPVENVVAACSNAENCQSTCLSQ